MLASSRPAFVIPAKAGSHLLDALPVTPALVDSMGDGSPLSRGRRFGGGKRKKVGQGMIPGFPCGPAIEAAQADGWRQCVERADPLPVLPLRARCTLPVSSPALGREPGGLQARRSAGADPCAFRPGTPARPSIMESRFTGCVGVGFEPTTRRLTVCCSTDELSERTESNRRPLGPEPSALPLSYCRDLAIGTRHRHTARAREVSRAPPKTAKSRIV